MFPNKLEMQQEYNYYHWQFFKNHLNITRAFIEKDYKIDMHEQEFFEINIILKGSGMHYIKDNRISAKQGDVFVIPPHVAHGYRGGKGFDVFHLLLSDSFINKYVADLQQLPSFFTLFSAEPLMRFSTDNNLHLTLNDSQLNHTKKLLKTILSLQDRDNPYSCLNSTNLSLILITFFCEVYSQNFNSEINVSQDATFMKTISYLHEHYHEKITLGSLIKMAQMSRSSYISKFKLICKQTPLAYLTKIRLEAAENLLINTQLPIAEIAFRTGFYDCAHFTKVFTAEKKISPLQFKKTN